ncbi:MAG TPA: HNH endonuclease, partial [Tianweitania sediminis]|nr:HNH endonuclease [Tianweitania sediminis]
MVNVDQRNPWTGGPRTYVLKHLHLWEQANGPVPDGMCLKCIGEDRTNCDPANWTLVPRGVLPLLNQKAGRDYDNAPAELKPLILNIARLEH